MSSLPVHSPPPYSAPPEFQKAGRQPFREKTCLPQCSRIWNSQVTLLPDIEHAMQTARPLSPHFGMYTSKKNTSVHTLVFTLVFFFLFSVCFYLFVQGTTVLFLKLGVLSTFICSILPFVVLFIFG
jgi:hypothetical protein